MDISIANANMDLTKLKQNSIVYLCLAITFFTSCLIVNAVQCVFYLGLHTFNKHLYRKINWYLCYTLYAQLVFMGDWWSGSTVTMYLDRNDYEKCGKEHALCVMNHSYEIDWLVGWMISNRISLLGNCKAFAKKSVQYLPGVGWAWKFAEFVFLERNFHKDKEIINKQIAELADHPDPIWLLLFPEGTRFTAEKHKVSQEFANERNLAQLKYHLQPRCRGFIASIPSMRGKVPAFYDFCLSFAEDDPVPPTIRSLVLGKPTHAHMYMRRIPFEEIPQTEAEQEKFLRDSFALKDKMRESFAKTGDFFKLSGVPRVDSFVVPAPVNSIVNLILWSIIVLCPTFYYLCKLVLSGQLLYIVIAVAVISGFAFLANNSINMSKISKGSSYGKTNTPKKTK